MSAKSKSFRFSCRDATKHYNIYVSAAEDAGTIFILSTLSTSSLEQVAVAAPNGIKWFQLYVYFDREVSLSLVRRAEKAGFKALVLTVDTPMFGDRRADMRNKFVLPKHLKFVYRLFFIASYISLNFYDSLGFFQFSD